MPDAPQQQPALSRVKCPRCGSIAQLPARPAVMPPPLPAAPVATPLPAPAQAEGSPFSDLEAPAGAARPPRKPRSRQPSRALFWGVSGGVAALLLGLGVVVA